MTTSFDSSLSTEFLDSTNVVYMFKCPLGDCVSRVNNTYVGLTSPTFSRRLTMLPNDSCSTPLHLKSHSISKSKFRITLVENTAIIAHKIRKLRLKILEALHIEIKKKPTNKNKTKKKIELIELTLKIATMLWSVFSLFLIVYNIW